MSTVSEDVISRVSEDAVKHLAELEKLHRVVQQNHARAVRSLDEAVSSDRQELYTVWNEYRVVVADLSRVTEEFESLRLAQR